MLPPKKLILGWLAVIGVFSGFLLYAVKTDNRIMVMILVAVYIAFGLYVTGRINRNNFWLVQLWRDAPPEITTWGKIWRIVLLLGFWVLVGTLIYFFGWPESNY